MKDDRLYLIHIRECVDRIDKYVADGRNVFLSSTLVQDAVLRNLQTLAESTQRLSDSFKASRTDIDWRAIAGFRNILVHDYLGVDIERIWDILADRLELLRTEVVDAP